MCQAGHDEPKTRTIRYYSSRGAGRHASLTAVWSLWRAPCQYRPSDLPNERIEASHARQQQLPHRGIAGRRHRTGSDGARARGAGEGRGSDPAAQIPLHRGAGGRRPLSRHRHVDAAQSTIKLCEEADAILLGACGLPHIRYPDNTEIMPQVELRFMFDLYAGVRPCRLIANVPSPIVGAAERGIDLVVIRESTEGLFASMGKGVVSDTEARETLLITRKTSQRLFDFAFRLARRRKARGGRGLLTCVDKANAFKAYAFFRSMFDECAARYQDVATDRLYVDACAAMLVRRPWDFDVMVMENMFGDIISDLTAGLIGGMGMAPSADIGDTHAVFQPCHGTAPDIMGKGLANPTAMILSAALMLDWLADRHGHEAAADGARAIESAVDRAFAAGLMPCEFGGRDSTAVIADAVLRALDACAAP